MTELRQRGAQVDGGCRLAHASLLVDHGDDWWGGGSQHLGVSSLQRPYIWGHAWNSSSEATVCQAGVLRPALARGPRKNFRPDGGPAPCWGPPSPVPAPPPPAHHEATVFEGAVS